MNINKAIQYIYIECFAGEEGGGDGNNPGRVGAGAVPLVVTGRTRFPGAVPLSVTGRGICQRTLLFH